MKPVLIFLSAVLVVQLVWAQQEKPVVVNEVRGNMEDLIRSMYQYPQFLAGRAFHKNGSIAEARFNYNYLSNQIVYIGAKGDTLTLINGGDFNRIAIQTDTFYYYNKEFIRQASHYPDCNLFVKHSLQNTGTEKKGAYDSYSSTTAITTVKTVDAGANTVNLAADENVTYTFRDRYYVSGKFNQFYPATKKDLYDLFSKKEKPLKEFLEKNKIDFNKKEDLEKLLVYMRTVL